MTGQASAGSPAVSEISYRLDVTGSAQLPEGVEMVMPGDNIQMEITLIAPIAMEKGLRFAIREGGRTVGVAVCDPQRPRAARGQVGRDQLGDPPGLRQPPHEEPGRLRVVEGVGQPFAEDHSEAARPAPAQRPGARMRAGIAEPVRRRADLRRGAGRDPPGPGATEPRRNAVSVCGLGCYNREFARDVRDALRAQVGKRYHVETDDGEDVLVKKRHGERDFIVTVVENSVPVSSCPA